MSDSDEFHRQQVLFNVRTRHPSKALRLQLDAEALGLTPESTAESKASLVNPDLLAPPSRERGQLNLEGIIPSWIDLDEGAIRLRDGLHLKPTIDIRKRGFKLELKWTW